MTINYYSTLSVADATEETSSVLGLGGDISPEEQPMVVDDRLAEYQSSLSFKFNAALKEEEEENNELDYLSAELDNNDNDSLFDEMAQEMDYLIEMDEDIKALNISDDKCYGVGDYGPWGWEVLHSFSFVKNPIECENVYNTNLKIVITPAFMTNFSEVKNTENTAFTDADKKIFKFLANPENKFKRFDQLKKMYVRQFKCDLDLLDFQKLLKAIEYAIDRDYVI